MEFLLNIAIFWGTYHLKSGAYKKYEMLILLSLIVHSNWAKASLKFESKWNGESKLFCEVYMK